ncbi:MAG: KH domain-containing protein [Verrucomicrobia bacterium]|nr:KH domain-containing protein [Verrucomicrobiota bacterium]
MNAPANVEWRTVIRFAENDILHPMLHGLGIDALIEIRHREEGTILSLEHPTESGRLIGRDGHTLEAIQYLVNLLVNKRFGATRAVLIDCAGYRGRLKAQLEKLAKDAARDAQRTGEPVTLEPMVAADRRVVHTALRDWPALRTVSVDEDPETGMKRVQIVPVGGRQAAPQAPQEAAESEDEQEENFNH